MKRREKREEEKSLYFFLFLIAMPAVIWIPQKTYAATPKIITLLDTSTTSKSRPYDLDNDGKKESLKLKSKQLPGVMNQELTI